MQKRTLPESAEPPHENELFLASRAGNTETLARLLLAAKNMADLNVPDSEVICLVVLLV